MNLREFVQETITEIVAGVTKAQGKNTNKEIILYTKSGATTIEFDVAVTAEEIQQSSDTKDVSGGIKVLSLHLGGGAKESVAEGQKNETVSRISFGVNIYDRG